jgi:hypothetical protein
MQLQYAAFYAARSGAVSGADEAVMKRTVKRILGTSQGLVSLPEGSVEVEILSAGHEEKNFIETQPRAYEQPLMVRVHWHHPLIVPFADKLMHQKSKLLLLGRPTIHLKASWATAMFKETSGGGHNVRKE